MIRRPGTHRSEPVWIPVERLSNQALPASLAPWVLDNGSLTRRLREACAGRLRVEVVKEGWAVPLHCERRALGLAPRRYAWVREVRLRCDDVPWVFARTVIPSLTLRGPIRRLARLGSRPLGEVLFSDPGIRRGTMEVARLDGNSLGGADGTVWGRRSLFHAGTRSLLVSEVFIGPLPPRERGRR